MVPMTQIRGISTAGPEVVAELADRAEMANVRRTQGQVRTQLVMLASAALASPVPSPEVKFITRVAAAADSPITAVPLLAPRCPEATVAEAPALDAIRRTHSSRAETESMALAAAVAAAADLPAPLQKADEEVAASL